jgi:hypothetical protein
MAATSILERITFDVDFDTEAEALAYRDEKLAEGFLPSAYLGVDGILTTSSGDAGIVRWTVHVFKQTHNGVITPRWRKGNRVTVRIFGVADWEPVDGTITKVERRVESASVEVRLDWPNPNEVRNVTCTDYEVTPTEHATRRRAKTTR